MIDILLPVLGRPANAERVVASIAAGTQVPWSAWFIATSGDDAQLDAIDAVQEKYAGRVGVIQRGEQAGSGDFARKQNLGFKVTGYGEPNPFVFLGADDLEFLPGWDTLALETAERTGASVIGTVDAANPLVTKGAHSTHTLVRRAYTDAEGLTWDRQPGVVYAECYDHQQVDNELVAVAKERGIWAFAHGAVVKHRHPIFDRTVPTDATYRKALSHGSDDLQLFRKRQATLGGKP